MTRFPTTPIPFGYESTMDSRPRRRRERVERFRHASSASAAPQLQPEEERNLLGSILGGVQYIGETLDKPGAAVRGALAGQPEQLLNLIPFSDTLGITQPEERVRGRELLENLGLLEPNRPGMDLGDWAGFGAEVALDPLTWLLGPLGTASLASREAAGARAAAGLAQKATGSLDELQRAVGAFKAGTAAEAGTISKAAQAVRTPATVAEGVRAGEIPLFALKVPFFRKPFYEATLGKNTRSSNLAAKALETMFYGGNIMNPIVGARALFSHTAGDALTGAAQRLADIKYAEKLGLQNQIMDLAPALRESSNVLQRNYESIAKHHGKTGDLEGFNAFTRAMLEAGDKIPAADEMVRVLGETMGVAPDALRATQEVDQLALHADAFLKGLKDTENIAYKRATALGLKGEQLTDIFAAHFGRRPGNVEAFTKGRKFTSTDAQRQFEYAIGRNALWRHVPGGTKTINEWSTDPLLTGWTRGAEGLEKMTKKQHLNALRKVFEDAGYEVEKGATLKDLRLQYFQEMRYAPALEEVWKNADETRLVRWSANDVGEQLTREQFFERTFAPHAVGTVGDVAPSVEFSGSRAEEMLKFFSAHGQDIAQGGLFNRRVVDDWFGYMRSLAETESTLRSTHRYLDQLAGAQAIRLAEDAEPGAVSLSKVWADAGFHRRGLESFMARHPEFGAFADEKELNQAISSLVVDEQAAGALTAFREVMKPANQNAFVEMTDKVTAAYKGLLTIPWPAFHTRNLLAGQWMNLADGRVGLRDLVAGTTAAWRHMATRGAKPLEFIDEIIENGVLGGHGQIVDILGREAAETISGVPQGPLGGALGVLLHPNLRERGFGAIDPRSFRGVVDKPKNLLGEAGEKLYEAVEFINRGGYYEALRKKGFTPSEALAAVKRTQFDYSELSKFEKNFARRVVPFWTFTRKNIPHQLAMLAERPGGVSAQTFRLFNQRDQEEYVPSFLREGMGLRVGGTDENAQFLRQGGLPIEDFNTLVFRGGLPSGRSLEKAAARMHPLLTLPIENFADKQLYTGRSLKDLRSTTEALTGAFGAPTPVPWLDRAIHYSPISRAVSEVAGVLDPRKSPAQIAMNALTGVKSSTYDVEKWRLIDLQNALRQQIEASPYAREVTDFYVPKRYSTEAAAAEPREQIRTTRALSKAIKALIEKREREGAK